MRATATLPIGRLGRTVRVERLTLVDFRNHAELVIALPSAIAGAEPGAAAPGLVLISGENGMGKTNILEALSLLAPGRGLRGARLGDMARIGGSGGFTVAARFAAPEAAMMGTSTSPEAPERRRVRINGADTGANSLAEWLSLLWLTPAMDRLFMGPAAERRRFLDRLTLAMEPTHGRHAARYEKARTERTKLLMTEAPDTAWLDGLEAILASEGALLTAARAHTIAALNRRLADRPAGPFARAGLTLVGSADGEDPMVWTDAEGMARQLRASRARDAQAGRMVSGAHRFDLSVLHIDKRAPAEQTSTGEQKALLIGIMLAHAALVGDLRDRKPILLLDEVAAHLDPLRRIALFEQLHALGAQAWLTATERHFYDGVSGGVSLVLGHDGAVIN